VHRFRSKYHSKTKICFIQQDEWVFECLAKFNQWIPQTGYWGVGCIQPKSVISSMGTDISFLLHAWYSHCGWDDTDISCFASACPSRTTFENAVKDFAVDSVMLAVWFVNKSGRYYLSFDKADKSKLGSQGGTVKLISWFSRDLTSKEYPDGQINTIPIDADVSRNGTGEEMANVVKHSVKKLGFKPPAKAGGTTVDSSGGEKSAHRPLTERGVIKEDGLQGNCTLHNLNLEVMVPCAKALMKADEQGQDARNVIQLIYVAYYWENEIGVSILREFWKESIEYCCAGEHNDDDDENDNEIKELMDKILVMTVDGDTVSFEAMIKGCVTRWSSIGEAATVLHRTLELWIMMATKFDDFKKGGKAKAASQDFLSRVAEKALICDLTLLKCHHQFYIKQHLTWLQSKDKLTRKAGFQSFNIFI